MLFFKAHWHDEQGSDPEDLGSQLSLLNLISSNEQSDGKGNMSTAFIASVIIIHVGLLIRGLLII